MYQTQNIVYWILYQFFNYLSIFVIWFSYFYVFYVLKFNFANHRGRAYVSFHVHQHYFLIRKALKILTTTHLVTKALQRPDANVLLEQAYQELYKNYKMITKEQKYKLFNWVLIGESRFSFSKIIVCEDFLKERNVSGWIFFFSTLDIICNQLVNRYSKVLTMQIMYKMSLITTSFCEIVGATNSVVTHATDSVVI